MLPNLSSEEKSASEEPKGKEAAEVKCEATEVASEVNQEEGKEENQNAPTSDSPAEESPCGN